MVCLTDRLNPVIISALRLFVGVLGYPKGSALELLDGTLKLRHCTDLFTMRLHPWSLPIVGNGSGKRQFITPGHLLDEGGNVGKRVRLTRKTRPGVISHYNPDPGHPTPRRWKRLRAPSSEGDGVRWADLAIFFFCTWGRLEPAFGGNRRGGVPAGQSSRRDQCTGAGPCYLTARVHEHEQTRSCYTMSAPQPPQPPQSVFLHSVTVCPCCLSKTSGGRHGKPWRTRWEQCCKAPQGAPSPSVASPRAADGADGLVRSSPPRCASGGER